MGAPRAGKSREGMVFIVETFSGTDSVSQVAKIKGTYQNIFNFVTALVSQKTCLGYIPNQSCPRKMLQANYLVP